MDDPCSWYPPCTLVDSVTALNSVRGWFEDPLRPAQDNEQPFVIVADEFYKEPLKVRQTLLGMDYRSYSSPDSQIVGEKIAATYADKPAGRWKSTAFTVFLGTRVQEPFIGERYNGRDVQEAVQRILGKQELIDPVSWPKLGDDWNGAGHLMDSRWRTGDGSIHHHYKPGDVEPRGWSGVVYLSPNAPAWSGTSIWLSRESGKCIAGYGATFEADVSKFKLALFVENKFNRLVLFRENVLHRAERGFGSSRDDARLTQTLFFRTIVG